MVKLMKHWTIFLFLVCFLFSPIVHAQEMEELSPDLFTQTQQPPMENIFFNVLWGSIAGGTVSMGWSVLDDSKSSEERYKFNNMTAAFIQGATYGGVIGLIAGVYFSLEDITFDEGRTRIAFMTPEYEPVASGESTSPVQIPTGRMALMKLSVSF